MNVFLVNITLTCFTYTHYFDTYIDESIKQNLQKFLDRNMEKSILIDRVFINTSGISKVTNICDLKTIQCYDLRMDELDTIFSLKKFEVSDLAITNTNLESYIPAFIYTNCMQLKRLQLCNCNLF